MPARARRRYAVPFAAAGLIALGAALPNLAAAGRPDLPARSPSELVRSVLGESARAFSGSVSWAPDLGLPSIGGLTAGGGQSVPGSSGVSLTDLLTSTESFEVWDSGTGHQRVASISPLAETDYVRRGQDIYEWVSSTQRVTRYRAGTLGPLGAAPGGDPANLAAGLVRTLVHHHTALSVGAPLRVAGLPAYDLVLRPTGTAANASTVQDVAIAVDAANGFPLRVTVTAKGQAIPALEVGFTSVSFARPAASVFALPSGSATAAAGSLMSPRRGGRAAGSTPSLRFIGSGWTLVGVLPNARALGPIGLLGVPVSGSWGTGQLLASSLLDALIVPGGTALFGLVEPAQLEGAAAHVTGGRP